MDRLTSAAIVRDLEPYRHYPFERVPQQVIEAFTGAAQSDGLPHYIRIFAPRLLKLLECLLAITGTSLADDSISSGALSKAFNNLLGALNSPKFIEMSLGRRYIYSKALLVILGMCAEKYAEFPRSEVRVSAARITESVLPLVEAFESCALEQEAVWLWRSWPSVNQHGTCLWLPLYPIYRRYGRIMVETLYAACDTYHSGKKEQKISGFNEFIDFLSAHPHATQEALQQRTFVTSFWRDFWHYYQSQRSISCKLETLVADWTGQWRSFVETTLTRPGLFTAPYGDFPGPDEAIVVKRAKTKKLSELLLLNVPTEFTDSEALHFMCKAIPDSVKLSVTWATALASDLMVRQRRRKALSRVGQVRELGELSTREGQGALTNRANPEYLMNAAATYEYYGHLTRIDHKSIQLLYPKDLALTAYELGLPTTTALLPHSALLVAEHPTITPSFLEHLQLWDKRGKLVGFRKLGACTYLIGYKYRRGKRLGQQRVPLTNRTIRIIWQILAVTRPLREYLKSRHDPNWRMLFLTCGKAFGYPNPTTRFASLTSTPANLALLADSFSTHCHLSPQVATEYAKRFSLKSLRNTKGVAVFVATHSEAAMAKSLGHEKRRSGLLGRYLPQEMQGFFRERWMRRFQVIIVVLITSNSRHVMRASGIHSQEQLDDVMTSHVFLNMSPLMKDSREFDRDESNSLDAGPALVLNASAETLSLLVNIKTAVQAATRPVNGVALYWSEFAAHVLAYLEARRGGEPSIARALDQAATNIDCESLQEWLYE